MSQRHSARPYAVEVAAADPATDADAKSDGEAEALPGSSAMRRSRLAANALPEVKLPVVPLHVYSAYSAAALCDGGAESSWRRRKRRQGERTGTAMPSEPQLSPFAMGKRAREREREDLILVVV